MKNLSTILIIGSGARESSLAFKCLKNPQKPEVYLWSSKGSSYGHGIALGNSESDHEAIVSWCNENRPELVIIGPEQPLVDGLSDLLRSKGFSVFGPSKAAAKLEESKDFAKEIMSAGKVPTAKYQSVTDYESFLKAAAAFKEENLKGIVIKKDGLCGGKGVEVFETFNDFEAKMDEYKKFWELNPGYKVVLEERLIGFEFSLFALCQDLEYKTLPIAQDYKRAYEGGKGPNTGGMGSYAPIAKAIMDKIPENIAEYTIKPILEVMKSRGESFSGLLYCGLMMTENGCKVLEYNVRFGDPECQSVMQLLPDDFSSVLKEIADGNPIPDFKIKDKKVVSIVVAAEGYPSAPKKGAKLIFKELPEDTVLFPAGIDSNDNASSGRVITVTSTKDSIDEARENCLKVIQDLDFEDKMYRNDIALLN